MRQSSRGTKRVNSVMFELYIWPEQKEKEIKRLIKEEMLSENRPRTSEKAIEMIREKADIVYKTSRQRSPWYFSHLS